MATIYTHPAPEELELITVLRALADPVRMELVRHLHRLGEANCSTLLGSRPKSSMSHHFQVLRESGILHTRIDGVNHRNTLRLDTLNARFPGLMNAILSAISGEVRT